MERVFCDLKMLDVNQFNYVKKTKARTNIFKKISGA